MRRFLLILMAMMLALTMAACGSESVADKTGTEMVKDVIDEQEGNKSEVADKAIIGSWSDGSTTWTFNDDGLGKVLTSLVNENDAGNNFYYSAEDGELTVTIGDETTETTYTIDGDKMTFKNDTGTSTYTRVTE